MQLEGGAGPVRGRLAAAACMLVAGSLAGPAGPAVPAGAAAGAAGGAGGGDSPGWQLDASLLTYGERNRTQVVEPIAKITRIYETGRRFMAQLGLDAITGASANGAVPSGRLQTYTTPSGRTVTSTAGGIPTVPFRDFRGSLDLGWTEPLHRLVTSTAGLHVSRERDYLSLGSSGSLAIDLDHRLMTFTVSGGYNRDTVEPIGGTRVPLTDAGAIGSGTSGGGGGGEGEREGSANRTDEGGDEGSEIKGSEPKRVASGMIGLSRILTRRWMVGVNAGRTVERGYLTEPYKVVSVYDPATGETIGTLNEKRPSRRVRTDILANSVYGLGDDVLYTSYRWYRDDWGVRSHTIDLRYRHELGDGRYLQPHLRWYAQRASDFFTQGLAQGAPLPDYASADYRLGPLRTATVGLGYGFRAEGFPGEFLIRGEWIRQWGQRHPPDAVGVQRSIDLAPPLDIGSVVFGYSLRF